MLPNSILGIPIIEQAAPGNYVAAEERELFSQLRQAIDMLRCPACGSLNYETTLFVFSTRIEKLIECRQCGVVHEELLDDDGLLGFVPRYLAAAEAEFEPPNTANVPPHQVLTSRNSLRPNCKHADHVARQPPRVNPSEKQGSCGCPTLTG
jgi:hypothetical protein